MIGIFLVSPDVALATSTTTSPPPTTTDPPSPPPIPVATSGGWSRDFNGPLDANFLALGFKFRGGYYESDGQLQVAPTFRRSTDGGVLKLWDDTPPSEEGAHTALAADFSMAFDKVRMSGTINPLGLPPIPDEVTGANNLGFIARGDLLSMSTYYAAIDFRDGRLRMGNVLGGQVYFAAHRASDGETLADMFADYKLHSYYLEFDVETYTGPDSGPMPLPEAFEFAIDGDVMLSARLYDERGGDLLISLDWLDESRALLSPGVSGVFVQSFEESWRNADLHPNLFGSFDDVSAVVPEPSTCLLAILGGGGLFAAARRPLRHRRR